MFVVLFSFKVPSPPDICACGHTPSLTDALPICVAANDAMRRFLADLAPELVGPPLTMMRATLHPDGLAPQIRNRAQWREVALRRVRRQLDRRSEEHTSELQSLMRIPYAVLCLKTTNIMIVTHPISIHTHV